MLEELNKLEKQYISMFTGREVKIKKTFEYEIIPENKDLEFDITRFSKKHGTTKDTLHKVVTLKLCPNESADNIQNYTEYFINEFKSINKPYKGFIYRIPAEISAEIIFDNNILYKKNIKISQFGSVNLLPAKIFNENISIEFYPQYGSLKRISKIVSE